MPARWTRKQEKQKRKELEHLYIEEKKTIFEVGQELGISWKTVYDRMQRLGIKTDPTRKISYQRKRKIDLPKSSYTLAEFTGIMLGDGQIAPRNGQVCITINTITDRGYIKYVANLLENLFHTYVSYSWRKSTVTIFISSVELLKKLKKIGLSSPNKVKTQVDIPSWIFKRKKYQMGFFKGLFDTDGSIYKLRFGTQMALTNRSWPLLISSRRILKQLGFHPSKISSFKIYLTRNEDLKKYFKEIGSGNPKHLRRARKFGIIKDVPRWRSNDRAC